MGTQSKEQHEAAVRKAAKHLVETKSFLTLAVRNADLADLILREEALCNTGLLKAAEQVEQLQATVVEAERALQAVEHLIRPLERYTKPVNYVGSAGAVMSV